MKRELYEHIIRKLTDEGKLVEAGWVALRHTSLPADATTEQVAQLRMAFFAGAQHLFASIMGILEPGAEPTGNDLRRMDLIHTELAEWVEGMKAESNKQTH